MADAGNGDSILAGSVSPPPGHRPRTSSSGDLWRYASEPRVVVCLEHPDWGV